MDIRCVHVAAKSKILLSTRNDLFLLSHDDLRFAKVGKGGCVLWSINENILCKPMDMTTISNDNLLISDAGPKDDFGRVIIVTASGKFIRYLITGLGSPVGIDCDPYDNVYICDQLYSCIIVTSQLGFILNVVPFHTPPLYVSIGNFGSMFVTDQNGVKCVSLDGKLLWTKKIAIKGKCFSASCGCACVLSETDASKPKLVVFSGECPHFSAPHIFPSEAQMLGVCNGIVGMAYPVMEWSQFTDKKMKQFTIVDIETGICSTKTHFLHAKEQKEPIIQPSLRPTGMQAIDYLDLNTFLRHSKCNNICKLDLLCDVRLENTFLMRQICLAYMKIERYIQSQESAQSIAMSRHIFFTIIRGFILNFSPEHFVIWSCAIDNQASMNIFNVRRALEISSIFNCNDDNGNTPLHLAIMKGNELKARLLLSFKVDLMTENGAGYTCLELSEALKEYRIKTAIAWQLSRQLLQICKEQRCKIHDIWPGYKCVEDIKLHKIDYLTTFCLVILFEHIPPDEELLLSKFNRIDIVLRSIYAVSKESECLSTMNLYDQHHFSSKPLPFISSEKASALFKKHSNLTIITSSPVSSHSYNSGETNILQKPSIVLFCRIKGVIPINEGPFPRYIDEYPTDVREGYFSFGVGGGPNDYHQTLRAGCCVGAENRGFEGTVGGFVELGSCDYFITCAHVVHDLRVLALKEGLETYLKLNTVHLYQPTLNTTPGNKPEVCGTVCKSVFKNGIHHEVSVDASLIKIQNGRNPVDGAIPAETAVTLRSIGYDMQRLPSYSSGDIVTNITDDMKRNQLIKYGANTGLTRGILAVDGCHVRVENKELELTEMLYGRKLSAKFEMYNQIEAESVGNKIFFLEGDSGSFVYMMYDNNPKDLRCIGMAIGLTSYRSCIITPIINVLQELGLPLKLKSFPAVQNMMQVNNIHNSSLPVGVHVDSQFNFSSDKKPSTSSSAEDKPLDSQRLEYCENMVTKLMSEIETLKSSKSNKAQIKTKLHTSRYEPYKTYKAKPCRKDQDGKTDNSSNTRKSFDNIPSVSSHAGVSSEDGYTSASSVDSSESVSILKSYSRVPSEDNYESVSILDSYTSVPSVESYSSTLSVDSYSSKSGVDSYASVPSVGSYASVPSVGSYASIPSVDSDISVLSLSSNTGVTSGTNNSSVLSVPSNTTVSSVPSNTSVSSVFNYTSGSSIDNNTCVPSENRLHDENQTTESEDDNDKTDLSQHCDSMAIRRRKIVEEFLKITKNKRPSESDITELWKRNVSLFHSRSFLSNIIEKNRKRNDEDIIIIDD